MANLSVEEPDALMHARPDLWEPWGVIPGATRPGLPGVGEGSAAAGALTIVSANRAENAVGCGMVMIALNASGARCA